MIIIHSLLFQSYSWLPKKSYKLENELSISLLKYMNLNNTYK